MKSLVLRHVLCAFAFLIIALFMGGALSTQLFAYLTDYHPGLGSPILRRGVPLYAPWAWFRWALSTGAADLALLTRSALPLVGALGLASYASWRAFRCSTRDNEPPPTNAIAASPATEASAVSCTQQLSTDDLEEVEPPDVRANRTHQLSWEDIEDVLLEEEFRSLTQQLSLEDIEEIDVEAALANSSFHADATIADASFDAATRDSDSIAYRILQALAAHDEHDLTPHDEHVSRPHDGLHVSVPAPTREHDAPTAEAPIRSLSQADMVEASASRAGNEPLHVDELRSDWAYEIATAEASLPLKSGDEFIPDTPSDADVRTTARFTDLSTSEGLTPPQPRRNSAAALFDDKENS